MAARVDVRTTFEIARAIEPLYTGGEISSDAAGILLATVVDDDVLVINVKTNTQLVRIEGDGESVTSLQLSPSASHVVICSRSLSMRIYELLPDEDKLSAKLLRTIKPHPAPVISTTIDSTGTILTTGGSDGIIKVWDIQGGYCSHTFHGHGGLVTSLELFEFGTVSLDRKQSKSRKRKIQFPIDHSADRFAESPSTSILLASGGEDGKIKIWDLHSRSNIATLDSHVSVVRAIKFSPLQKMLLSASRDRTIVLWDPSSWTIHRVIPCLETLEAAGFVPESKFCYSGGDSGRLRIWEIETGREVTAQQNPGLETEVIVAAIVTPIEEALLTIHQDQTIVMHSYRGLENLPSGKIIPPLPILRRISGNYDEVIDMACVGPDRHHLALATNTESIKIVSITESVDKSFSKFGSDTALLDGHQDIIICLDVDWSGHWLATGAKDNTARLWRLDPSSDTFECFAIFQGHAESLGAIVLPKAPLPDSASIKDPLNHAPTFVITGSQDKTVKRWDTSKLSMLMGEDPHMVSKAVYTRVAHDKDINALDASQIAPLFASASQDRTMKVWSIEDGSTTAILKGHKRGVWSVKFSPAGTPPIGLAEGGATSNRGLLISGSGDRTVKVWSLSTYTCLLTLEGHSNSVLKVLWLPPPGENHDLESKTSRTQKMPMIASASADTLVKLWNPYASLDSDHLLATLDNHTDRVWSLATPLSISSSRQNTPSTKSSATLPFTFLSGAADATLTFWKDTTTATAEAASKHVTERIEQDQMLQNYIRTRNYRESISLALTLNHPGRLLKIFEDVVNLPEIEKESASIMGIKAVDEVLSSLSMTELYRLLERIRDWNTNARTAPVAQRILNVLLKAYPAQTWTDMAKNQRKITTTLRNIDSDGTSAGRAGRKMMPMGDLFRALEVYTERHYKRMEELIDESYLIEYTLREMDELTGGQDADGLALANGNTTDRDMIML